jgi:regulator of protease activity HflC (stomatin/prohibitin superfamily)
MSAPELALLILGAVVVLLIAILVTKAVVIVPQTRVANVERLGRFRRTLQPGPNFVVPFLDRVKPLIDLREQVVSLENQRVITEDNLVVHIDTVLFYQVTDPRAADYEISNYQDAIGQLSATTLRSVIGGMELEQALTSTSRDKINAKLRGVLDEASGKWGIRVTRVEIQAIDPAPSIMDAMEREYRARRAKRAGIELGRDAAPDVALSAALESVSKADPSNIQEVAAAQLTLSNLYYENVLSQAKRSFNAAVAAGIGGSLFFLAAIIFAIAAKQLTASLISSVGGAVVEVVSGLNFWLYARTAVQLNSFHMRLERMQRYLVANSVAASLNGEQRESTRAKLVLIISEGEPRRET